MSLMTQTAAITSFTPAGGLFIVFTIVMSAGWEGVGRGWVCVVRVWRGVCGEGVGRGVCGEGVGRGVW